MNGTRAVLIGIIAATVGCQPRNAYVPPPPAKVSIAQPVITEVTNYVEFTGTTRATDTIQLRSRVNGYLKEIAFQDGATVEKDTLLFVIESEPYEVALRSAKAAVEKAKAALELAENLLARSEQLAESDSVAREEVDVRRAERNSAKADVAAAEAAVKRAELDLSYTRILAPAKGRIGRHLVDVGNLIQAEVTQLATIEAFKPIHVYFNISEGDYLRFMELRRANVIPDPSTHQFKLHLALANDKGFPHDGVLDYLDAGIDPESGTMLRRGIFQNTNGELVPGLFVRIRAAIGAAIRRVLIEERAVATDQRGDYVLVVDEQNMVHHRPVKLGQVHGHLRVVESGLKEGEWIVVNGVQRARPGATVDPQREVTPPLTPATAQSSDPAPQKTR